MMSLHDIAQSLLLEIHNNCSHSAFGNNTLAKLAIALQIPKTQISSALKTLMTEMKIVQIQSKPHIYLSAAFLKEMGLTNLQSQYESMEELNRQVQSQKDQRDKKNNPNGVSGNIRAKKPDAFLNVIGSHYSLKSCISQVKATLSYPPAGLPMLLLGPTGTGKSLIAKTAYEWAKEQNLLSPGGKFVTVNCSEFANNPELLTANLFGYVKGAFTGAEKDNPGLAAAANGGILFLDEVHNLRYECQEKLFLLMDQGIYHMMGDNENWHTSNCRIIFATTEDPEKVLLKTLQRRIPVTIQIPPLEERSFSERLELISFLYRREEKVLKRPIYLSPTVLNQLLYAAVPGNIGGLKSAVQYSCISSLYEAKEGPINIRLNHLPASFLKDPVLPHPFAFSFGREEGDLLSLNSLQAHSGARNILIPVLEEILKGFESLNMNAKSQEEQTWLKASRDAFDQYLSRFESSAAISPLQAFYKNGLTSAFAALQLPFEPDQASVLSAFCYEYDSFYLELLAWNETHTDEISDLLEYMQNQYFRASRNGISICEYLNANMELKMLPCFLVLMILYLFQPDKDMKMARKACIILAHGRATASSIAEAANQMLQNYVFDALDMPVYIQPDEILQRLSVLLRRMGRLDELYLLVDMGSLMDLPSKLDLPDTDVSIINNISTLAALELGSQVLQGKPMDSLVPHVAEQSYFQYKIQKGKRRKPVILCSCLSGIGTAIRLQSILQSALPATLEVEVPVVSYEELISLGMEHPMIAGRNVLGLVGTVNPDIEGLPFAGIENLVLQEEENPLVSWLEPYGNPLILEQIQNDLTRSFSLSNLMNELTILNPSKLLEKISTALDLLQSEMGIHLSQAACFGLYIHICCMVERLVLNDFEEEKKSYAPNRQYDFFKSHFSDCFLPVEQYYHISIPDGEARMVYSYIQNDSQKLNDF